MRPRRATALAFALLAVGVSASSCDGQCDAPVVPQRTVHSMAPKEGAPSPVQFADVEIADIRTGATKPFGSLWKDKPLVVAFLRRLG